MPHDFFQDLNTDDFSLEDILAEYGSSRGQKLMEDVDRAVDGPPPPPPPPPPVETVEELPRPRPVSLEEVVGSTVDAVMESAAPKKRRGLFSRKEIEDTEQLPQPPPPPPEEPPLVEPDLWEVEQAARKAYKSHRTPLLPAFLVALLPTALLVALSQGVSIPVWTARNEAFFFLGCLGVLSLLCQGVYQQAFRQLMKKRCTGELLTILAVLSTMGDCVLRITSSQRIDVTPYAAVSCLALFFAQAGAVLRLRGDLDALRTATIDSTPPYLIAETEKLSCKQSGSVRGFYTAFRRPDYSTIAQSIILPLTGMAALVFSGLSTLGRDQGANFLLHLSILLSAAATFSLPLCWALPWAKLARHLQKAGCALAGWAGADRLSRKRSMVITDIDLFPPGEVELNGIKIYAEERSKVVSYAASMALAADCGLGRLFDGLLRSELGQTLPVEQFAFYAEGGYTGLIRGESVLLGTASFMRKMDVRLPGDIHLKTGVFLAVDKELVAVFAVKYTASDHVDFALKLLRRDHVSAVLASRDPNVTPPLLKRKFGRHAQVEYPDLTIRVALSEAGKDQDLAKALIFREGLLPYAETIVGARRVAKAVRRSTILSLLGSAAGTLLTAYLTSLGSFSLVSPLALEAFLLLWALPVVILGDFSARY